MGWRRGLKSHGSRLGRKCLLVPELAVSSVHVWSWAWVLADELAWFSPGKAPERPGSEEAGGFTRLASCLGESDLADTISPHQLGRNLVLCGEVKSSPGSGEYSQVSQHTELLVFSADRGNLLCTGGNYSYTLIRGFSQHTRGGWQSSQSIQYFPLPFSPSSFVADPNFI